jgi:hypothetical protein
MRFDDTNPAKEKEDFEKVCKVIVNYIFSSGINHLIILCGSSEIISFSMCCIHIVCSCLYKVLSPLPFLSLVL